MRPASPALRWALPAVALLLRLVLLQSVGRPSDSARWNAWTMEPDSYSYLELARDLSDGSQDSVSGRTPGYPFLILATGGLEEPAGAGVVLLQQLADFATAVLIGSISLRLGCGRPEIPSTLYMILPAVAATSSRILPDSFVALLAAASGWVWMAATDAAGPRRTVVLHGLTGLILAVGAAVKPVLLFGAVPYLLLLPFVFRRLGGAPAALCALALAVSAASLPMAMRIGNLRSFGLDAVSSQDGFEQMGRIVVMTGRATQVEVFTTFRDSLEALATVDGELDFGRRDSIYRQVALSEAMAHPGEVILPHLLSWPRFFSTGTGNTLRYLGLRIAEDSAGAKAIKLGTAALLLVPPLGLLLGLLSRRVRRASGRGLALALAWAAPMALVHGPLAGPRYALPFLWAVVAAGITSLCLLLRRRNSSTTKGASDQ